MTKKTNRPDKDAQALEELMDKVSQAEDAEAERHVRSPAGQQALRELQDHSERVIREARRRALDAATADTPTTSPSIPQRILDMTRAALLERLEELRAMFGGQLAVQYRNLEAQSLDDLRSLLAEIETRLDSGEPEA